MIKKGQFGWWIDALGDREESLSLVDIIVSATNEFPIIDVKIRNNSDEVIILKLAEITTLGQWDIPTPNYIVVPTAVQTNWTYDVAIPLDGTAKYNMSQQVEPNSVGGFKCRAGSDHLPHPFIGLFAYLLRIKLIYNENNREVRPHRRHGRTSHLIAPPVLLHIPAPYKVVNAVYIRPGRGALDEYKKVAQEILGKMRNNTIVQEGIIDSIKLLS